MKYSSRAFRSVSMLLAAGSMALVSTVAGAADDATVAAAKKEGKVVWYTGLIIPQIVRPIADAFKAKYGIEIEATRGDQGIKVLKEARAGKPQADLYDGAGTEIPQMIAADALDKYASPSIGKYPDNMKDANGYWAIVSISYLTAAVNTELVKDGEEPKTFQDLLDPKWKDKLAWSNDPGPIGPAGFIGNVMLTMGDQAGMEYLKKLQAQNITTIPGSPRVVLDQVIAGQYPVGLMTLNHHSVISANQGAPVKWLKMEPLVQDGNYVALVKNAQHPNAARLLVDFMFSDEGQTLFANANYIPANPSVLPVPPDLRADVGKFKSTFISLDMRQKYLAGWQKIYKDMFQ